MALLVRKHTLGGLVTGESSGAGAEAGSAVLGRFPCGEPYITTPSAVGHIFGSLVVGGRSAFSEPELVSVLRQFLGLV